MEAKFERDDYGAFRISVDGEVSDPVGYSSVATLEINGKKYMAVSNYFEGKLPCEQVFEVTTFKTNMGFFKGNLWDTMHGEQLRQRNLKRKETHVGGSSTQNS